jgi:hypothetical protein
MGVARQEREEALCVMVYDFATGRKYLERGNRWLFAGRLHMIALAMHRFHSPIGESPS